MWIVAASLIALSYIQCFSSSEPPTLRAMYVKEGPKFDGSLDGAVWDRGISFTDFKMVEPTPNGRPSEKTELRIIYDKDNLYLGIHCFDSEPSRISARTFEHDSFGDQFSSEDLIRVLLDPFQDKRNAYVFLVNPLGARSEGMAYGDICNLSWDGIWDARSRILKDGWSVNIKIPFKTISFNPRLKYWGLNVERYVPRKLETIRLSGPRLDSFFYNAKEAAPLQGIAGVKQGRGITFRPYGKAGAHRNHESEVEAKRTLEGGFDIYKNLTPNLVGVLSYNTDFAETEVDDRRVNLTRFPLYYPEKRTFFLEGSEIFDFGPAVGYSSSFVPFYTRRIGAFEGNPIPILFGTKFYGKIGNTNFSALDVQTKRSSELGLGRNNLFAARLYQNIWAESKVGIIFTNGDPSGGRNQLLGFDLTYRTSRFQGTKNFLAGIWSVYNWNQEKSGKPYGFGFKVAYPNDLWDAFLTYSSFGDGLNPGLGFLPRNGVQWMASAITYSPRPEKGWIGKRIRKLSFMLGPVAYWDLAGNLESYEIWISPLNAYTEKGYQIEFNIIPKRDVLPFDFGVSKGIIIPKGAFNFINYQLKTSSPVYNALSVTVEGDFGRFYSGTLEEAKIGLLYKFKGHISLGFSSDIVHGRLPQGHFDNSIYQLKADVFLSPRLGLMNYLQYDSASRNLGINIRFRWEISPGNEIYLVYNKDWERRWDPTARFFPLAEYGAIKIQLSIRP